MASISVTSKQYIEQREESYFIKASRVSLDSVVNAFVNGVSPEGIIKIFPVLNLEQVYGAIAKLAVGIAFCLVNKKAIDSYLQERKQIAHNASDVTYIVRIQNKTYIKMYSR